MKKLGILFMAVMIAAIAGCAGDDSTEPGGTLTTVQGLEIDETSTGRTVVLVWNGISDEIDGYEIYFKADGTGSWVVGGTSTTTTFTHNATVAGTYAVRAYNGDNYSENYSNEVSTMPNIVNVTYSIYDNYAPADYHSGFIFGATSGQTGFASQTGFVQDIYAYDESKGDGDVWLYSGNFGQFGNGNQSYFQTPASGVYGNCDPNGTWYSTSYQLYSSDSVVFIELPYASGPSAYAKMYGLQITPEPTSNNGTEVSFMYEYQSNDLGLTLFTSNAN